MPPYLGWVDHDRDEPPRQPDPLCTVTTRSLGRTRPGRAPRQPGDPRPQADRDTGRLARPRSVTIRTRSGLHSGDPKVETKTLHLPTQSTWRPTAPSAWSCWPTPRWDRRVSTSIPSGGASDRREAPGSGEAAWLHRRRPVGCAVRWRPGTRPRRWSRAAGTGPLLDLRLR